MEAEEEEGVRGGGVGEGGAGGERCGWAETNASTASSGRKPMGEDPRQGGVLCWYWHRKTFELWAVIHGSDCTECDPSNVLLAFQSGKKVSLSRCCR